ncbi:MAG TPA: 3-deoxy-7-phosphoheptulonate synthase class II [Planctomycetota bacterium]|nr:3-deoxy-7-phosphoheptulonate synthase class II [Planctomycetota bacterium]OQC21573.1 MAG: Phospho-2-dehydro-3-deoxyheptonate aldolase [Planctomycetes bacterium ADurb.Bin069]HNR98561.1 3-deoxy-7-phosphoheptulonate synthase class II [Planctomycetota bacterium]HOE28785.1 3-deoxy-7-phosphoheptulonate synthase class II [Planctomycetota bacterium]HOE85456.1 3-deoxy-7-phosphoheptulonate synthase class II [Planctomycetota bacterium]
MDSSDSPRRWSPDSWRAKPAAQMPTYRDADALQRALARLARLPPLVTSWEVETLKRELGDAARGRRFVLQGGDCSENFEDCESGAITNKLKILLQMSLVLIHGGRKRVIRLGRFAGQYAKPRSADTETVGGVTLPSYRGDMINSVEPTETARAPDPRRMLRAYHCAALTLNFIRALVDGGFADLQHPEYWDLDFVAHSAQAAEFRRIVQSVGSSLQFMQTLSGRGVAELNRVDFFTSHEGLHLPYEQAQTRRVPRRAGWYNLAAHFPWIGNRTRNVGGAHVEYFRGIVNPIGVKIGPPISPGELMALIEVLDPDNEPGRLTLIHRFGADAIGAGLPPLLDAVRASGRTVLWICDPMHGNTEVTREGFKTRSFDRILAELDRAFEIHRECGTVMGGVHAELTGDNVTECLGGARGITEEQLHTAYRTQVDPRLNYEQALEMALLIARRMAQAGT